MQKSGPYFAKYFCCVKSIRKNVPNFDVCHPTPAPRSHKSVNLGSHCGTLLIHRKRLILTSVSSLYLSSRVTPCFLKFFQVWGVLKGDQKLMQTPFFCATFLFLEHSHKRTSINYVDWILRILTSPPLLGVRRQSVKSNSLLREGRMDISDVWNTFSYTPDMGILWYIIIFFT